MPTLPACACRPGRTGPGSPPWMTSSGSDGSNATDGSRAAATTCTPAPASRPAAARSASTPRAFAAMGLGAGRGRRGRELGIDPHLDRGADLVVEPPLESAAPDLVEPILLDLAAVARLEELVDRDTGGGVADRVADVADLAESEHCVLVGLRELVRGHPAELTI